MAGRRFVGILVLLTICDSVVAASSCFGAGDIAGAVIGTLLCTILLCAIGYYVYRYFQKKKDKDRPLTSSSPDSALGTKYAYDNPYYDDDEPNQRNQRITNALDAVERGEVGVDGSKNNSATIDNKLQEQSVAANKQKKFGKSSKSNLKSNLKNSKPTKQRALDDSCINLGPETITVPLRGIDFTGLGFNICGNMRDGIYIKDVLNRGPAMESGKIKSGDRILSVTVSFANMVYEDALTILSYASPYNVQLEVLKMSESGHLPGRVHGHQKKGSNASNTSNASGGERLCHPLYRSHSIGSLPKFGREDAAAKRSMSVGGPAKLVTKKESPVKTSQSLREETSVDIETSASSSPRKTEGDGSGSKTASRFTVRKVSEPEGNKAMKASGEGSELNSITDSDGHRRKESTSSSDLESSKARKEDILLVSKADSISVDQVHFDEKSDDMPETRVTEATNKNVAVNNWKIRPGTTFGDGNEDTVSMSSASSSEDLAQNEVMTLDVDSPQLTMELAKRVAAPGKRKAPLPPSKVSQTAPFGALPMDEPEIWTDRGEENVTVVSTDLHHVTTLKVSPDIHDIPSWVKDEGSITPNVDVGNVAIQTNFSSDSASSSSSEDELDEVQEDSGNNADEPRKVTKKADKKKKNGDKNRKASSLGDLTKVEDGGQKGFLLERSVSMDLNHAEALPVHGHLGLQRGQIAKKLTIAGENGASNGDERLTPLKKQQHFGANENLHLDDGYKKSWENLEKIHTRDGEDPSSVKDDTDLSHHKLPVMSEATLLDRSGDGMSDIPLSDDSSSLSDDSFRARKTNPSERQRAPLRKMKPIQLFEAEHHLSNSSSSSSDEEDASPVIKHNVNTGSSVVTIGTVTSQQSKNKKKLTTTTTPIDPEMTKIFNNITVSNATKEQLVTLDIDDWTVVPPPGPTDDKNGTYDSQNGNGTSSPNSDQRFETTLELDVSGNGDKSFGLIDFGSTSPPPPPSSDQVTLAPQKPMDGKFTGFTVSEGAVSPAVIISNPQLTSRLPDVTPEHQHDTLDGPPKLQPPE